MGNIRHTLIKFLKNKNFMRAAVIYVGMLLLGVVGFAVGQWAIGGKTGSDIGWYFMNCVAGLGSGFALALLNNGHKKPVTIRSVASTVTMTVLVALVMFFCGAPVLSIVSGWGISMVGSALGFWFCRWENKKAVVEAEEIIDIFDKDMNKIGELSKPEAHDRRQWHKNAHIWVTDGSSVLVQLRSSQKKIFPNIWDASVGGHFTVGDTPLQCARREWAEELGLPWEFGDLEETIVKALEFCGEEALYEFIYLFFVKSNLDMSEVKLLEAEVADVKWLPFDEFKKKIKTNEFCPYGADYWNTVVEKLSALME